MAVRAEMTSLLASAQVRDAGESLVRVLCVEFTYTTQKLLETSLSATAAGSAAATEELRKLPGTHLRLSPDTTIHGIRTLLQEQQSSDSLTNAHFFAVHAPPASLEGVESSESFLPLQNTATLNDVLASGPLLRCTDDTSGDAADQMLVLVYMRESEYGFDGDDFLLGALCAGLCACCIALCATGAARSAEKKKKKDEQQQYQQYPQYPQYQQQAYYGNNAASSAYPAYYSAGQPAGQPYSYGAPPEYPTAQPAYYNYSGQPQYEQIQPPPPPPAQYYTHPQGQKQGPGTSSPSTNTGAPAPL
ncbi:hypothetical protein, unknown function [Leishmania tarentolae]|uniref:Uncharacterized protein n=1 Tax=Leishmania tarentolae TaxID=5689 RepID=A0A640KI69_LEITA|nr:hypothetical protein, unknown function [Leishmania tarentolae]